MFLCYPLEHPAFFILKVVKSSKKSILKTNDTGKSVVKLVDLIRNPGTRPAGG